MKITESKLRQIIREELSEMAGEVPVDGGGGGSPATAKPPAIELKQVRRWNPGLGEFATGFFRIDSGPLRQDWSIGSLDLSGHTTPAAASPERESWGYVLLDQNFQDRINPKTRKPYPPMTATALAINKNSKLVSS